MLVNEHVRFGEGGTGDPATGDRPLLYREGEHWYAIVRRFGACSDCSIGAEGRG